MTKTAGKAGKAELKDDELERVQGGATRSPSQETSQKAEAETDPIQKVRSDDTGGGRIARAGLADAADP